MTTYNSLASVYDKWTRTFFDYHRVADVLARVVPDGLKQQCVLDICCGTGTLAEILAGRGAWVTGVDQSAAMLQIAQERLQSQACVPTLLLQDVRQMEQPARTFGAAVSTLDSLNYFTLEELSRIFRAVRVALRPDGVFVFDLNTPHKLRHQFGNSLYAEAHEDYAYIWRNALDGSKIRFDIEIFRRAGPEGLYERSHETHQQHIVEISGVVREMERAGFYGIETFDDYSDRPLEANSLRATIMGRAT